METTSRIPYWDNLKSTLIFLVVLGHFLLPVNKDRGNAVYAVYTWIYMFHMPAFVFVSGFFSRRYVQKKNLDIRKPVGFAVLYVVFSILIGIIEMLFSKHSSLFSLFSFSPSGAQWYLMCMFLWYLLIPYCARFRPLPLLLFSLAVSLLVGFESECGNFLALSRCIVFFPFFLAGYYFDGSLITRIRPWMRIISALLLLFALFSAYYFRDFFTQHASAFNGRSAYSSHVVGLLERICWYISASILIAALFCVIPKRTLFFTSIGQRTLAIYILHRLARDICVKSGLYDYLGSGISFLGYCLILSLVATLVFSERHLTVLFNKAFSADYKYLLNDPDEL